ncbi:MAG: hypothetical protein SV377_02995 [Halobacteria archaeon]|nr:hypothetical protein [Halobacteria archaeon]
MGFGEYSYEALSREFEGKLNVEITNLQYLGTIENIFSFRGGRGHEIGLVYEGDDGNVTYEAIWKSVEDFKHGDLTLRAC